MKTNNKSIKLGLRFLKENHETKKYLQTIYINNITLKDAYTEVENYNNKYNCDDLLFTFNMKVYADLLFNIIPRFRDFIKVKYNIDDYFFKRKIVFQRAVQIYNFVEKYNDDLTNSFRKLFKYSNVNELAFQLLQIEMNDNKHNRVESIILDYYKHNLPKYKENSDTFFILCFYYIKKIKSN